MRVLNSFWHFTWHGPLRVPASNASRTAQGLEHATCPAFFIFFQARCFIYYHVSTHVRTMPHGHPCPWETFATGALVWPPCLSPKSIDPSSVDSCINAFGSSGGSFCSCSSFNLWPSAPWCAWCASVSCRSFCWRFGKKLGLAACETKSKLSQSTIKRGPRWASTDWSEYFSCGSKPCEEWKVLGNNSQWLKKRSIQSRTQPP